MTSAWTNCRDFVLIGRETLLHAWCIALLQASLRVLCILLNSFRQRDLIQEAVQIVEEWRREEGTSLCNLFVLFLLRAELLFLIENENVSETRCGLYNYTTVLICNIEILFTRMCMIEKGKKSNRIHLFSSL